MSRINGSGNWEKTIYILVYGINIYPHNVVFFQRVGVSDEKALSNMCLLTGTVLQKRRLGEELDARGPL